MQDEKRMDETQAMEIMTEEALAAEHAEMMPNVQEMLQKAELLAQEHRDAWLRARAEADNIRKRAQVDISNAHKYAIENFATDLLAVKDSLEAAIAIENASLENMKSGVELTLKQLVSVFAKFNVNEINPVGERFDPHHHQAITVQESDEAPNTVLSVLQKGYRLNERIVRPALVIVSKARGS